MLSFKSVKKQFIILPFYHVLVWNRPIGRLCPLGRFQSVTGSSSTDSSYVQSLMLSSHIRETVVPTDNVINARYCNNCPIM